MHKLAQSVLAYIRKNDLLRPGDRVGVAVSGGADSVALLRLMLELRDELGILPSLVHLNHELRGADSDADERFVRELANTHALEVIVASQDVKALAAERKLSLEAAAREARYTFFESLLKTRESEKIATAHTVDDQAETVVLRLLRGTGFRGLGGIRPRLFIRDAAATACGEIIRPLLNATRDAVRDYLADARQNWREDKTNDDLKYTRNRVRQLLMPLLQKEFNPAIAEKLSELAEIAQGEELFWKEECARLLNEIGRINKMGWPDVSFYPPIANSANLPSPITLPAGPGTVQTRPQGKFAIDIGLNLEKFRELPLAVQRRVLQSLDRFGIEMEFKSIDEIIRLVGGHTGSPQEVQVPGGWRVICIAEELRFVTGEQHTSTSDYEYELAVPGKVFVIEAGVEIEACVVNGSSETEKYAFQHLVDPRVTCQKWVVRNWRAGERFWPAHTKEPKKIKELLQDRHITGDEKQRWPVIACGGEIIWVRGLGVRRDFQASGAEGVLIRELPGDLN